MRTQQVQGSCGEAPRGKKEGGGLVGWAPEVSNGWSGSQRTSQPPERSHILHRPLYTLCFTQHQS